MSIANTLKHQVFYFQKPNIQMLALLAFMPINMNYLDHLIAYCFLTTGFGFVLIVLSAYIAKIMRVAMVPGIGNIDVFKLKYYDIYKPY